MSFGFQAALRARIAMSPGSQSSQQDSSVTDSEKIKRKLVVVILVLRF